MKFKMLVESEMITELSQDGKWVTFKNGQHTYIGKNGDIETGTLKGYNVNNKKAIKGKYKQLQDQAAKKKKQEEKAKKREESSLKDFQKQDADKFVKYAVNVANQNGYDYESRKQMFDSGRKKIADNIRQMTDNGEYDKNKSTEKQMKAMANAARKEAYFTEETPYSKAAYAKYKTEADAISERVRETKSKLPLERKAQAMASRVIRDRIEDEANGLPYREAVKVLETERVKKIRAQAIAGARAQLGSKRPTIEFTDREWEAIQAGAVSKTTFKEALRYADQDKLKERAMPRQKQAMSSSKKALALAKLRSGYTQQEVADAMGVSVTTIQKLASE